MAGGPIWYELMTPDVAAITPFYRAVAGWTIPAQGSALPNGGQYHIITRATGGNAGGVLALSPEMLAGGARPFWFPYFHVADVAAVLEQASGMGATVWMELQDIPGTGQMALIADPQGAPFYIMAPTPPAGAPDAKSDAFDRLKPGHCRWMQLDTTDAPGANAFYTALFDWNTDKTMSLGPAGDYRFIEFEGAQIGAFNPMIAQGAQPQWLMYFGVADIEAARDAVQANGGTIAKDIHEVPGGEFVLVTTDPAGAAVAFVGPKGA